MGTLNRQRVIAAMVALAFIAPATEIDALLTLAFAALLTGGLVAYEAIRFAEARRRYRGAEAGGSH